MKLENDTRGVNMGGLMLSMFGDGFGWQAGHEGDAYGPRSTRFAHFREPPMRVTIAIAGVA